MGTGEAEARCAVGVVMRRLLALLDRLLPVGPRSVLWGSHAFWLHPFCVAYCWWQLYGFPWDARLWVLFCVHDLGYALGWCTDMDGTGPRGGQWHPEKGARIMLRLFGVKWYDLSVGHSRYYARYYGIPVSPLMRADKLATAILPTWLFVGLITLSGEAPLHVATMIAAGECPEGSSVWTSARLLQAQWWARYKPGMPDEEGHGVELRTA